jgi:hypothetical protein
MSGDQLWPGNFRPIPFANAAFAALAYAGRGKAFGRFNASTI